MKIKIVPTIIALAIGAILAYCLYSLCKTEGREWIIAIGGFICLFLPLATGIGVRFAESRTSVNTAVLGWVFFLLMLISHGIFAFVQFSVPVYVIVNGILLIAFLGVTYAVAKARQ